MEDKLILLLGENYQEYLKDESRFTGCGDSISFPESEEEILKVLSRLKSKSGITIQGGKTGITGSCVPENGHIMNLSRMNKVKRSGQLNDGTYFITVEPGITLLELEKEISRLFRKENLFWPPSPTEKSATVGGIAATNAMGINACYYGDTKQYFEEARLVKADGTVDVYKRGRKRLLINGRETDELDLLLGTEGIVGVFSELTLRLLPKPKNVWGISFFFEAKEDLGIFVKEVRENIKNKAAAFITAIEYMDRATIDIIEERKPVLAKLRELPDVEAQFIGLIYMELAGIDEEIEELAEKIMELAQACNSNPDKAWAVSGETEIVKMREFRHAAAETVNQLIEEARRTDRRITKLGTDMSLPDADFLTLLHEYESDINKAGIRACIFGHTVENHLHVNLLPKDYEEYEKGKELIRTWAVRLKEKGGAIVCEHGIGKLKRDLLKEIISESEIQEYRSLKKKMDSCNVWNQGNIFR